jgi:hypothetical protein
MGLVPGMPDIIIFRGERKMFRAKGIHIKSRLDECKKFDEELKTINKMRSKKFDYILLDEIDIPLKLIEDINPRINSGRVYKKWLSDAYNRADKEHKFTIHKTQGAKCTCSPENIFPGWQTIKNNPDNIKQFTNTVLGIPWEPKPEPTYIQTIRRMKRTIGKPEWMAK